MKKRKRGKRRKRRKLRKIRNLRKKRKKRKKRKNDFTIIININITILLEDSSISKSSEIGNLL